MEILSTTVQWALTTATQTLPIADYFFTIEGGDGSGKTTLISSLSKTIGQLIGEDKVVVVRDPGGTAAAEEIRSIITSHRDYDLAPQTEFLLFNACRTQLISEVIIPALNEGKVVLADRFIDSTIVYQILLQNQSAALFNSLLQYTNCPLPKKTLVLNVDPNIGLSRADVGHFEEKGTEFAASVNKAFRLMTEVDSRFTLIDSSTNDADAVYQLAFGAIAGLLPQAMSGEEQKKQIDEYGSKKVASISEAADIASVIRDTANKAVREAEQRLAKQRAIDANMASIAMKTAQVQRPKRRLAKPKS